MKRITTALLAMLLVFSLSVAVWAEEPEIQETPEICEDPVVQETPENQEDPSIQETPEPEVRRELPIQETFEIREEASIRESPEPAEKQESTENPKSTEKRDTEKKQESAKKKQEKQISQTTTEAQTEQPVLGRETCEAFAAFFREDAGLNDAVIAGILANIQRESGFDPTRVGDSGKAFGLCQWNEKRQKRLDSLCKRAELNRDDISTQQIFMIAELQVYFPDTWMLLNWLEETEDDAAWAAWYICKNYEAPVHVEEELLIREQLAKDYFQLLTAEK